MSQLFTQTITKGDNDFTVSVDDSDPSGGVTVCVFIGDTFINERELTPVMVTALSDFFAKKVF